MQIYFETSPAIDCNKYKNLTVPKEDENLVVSICFSIHAPFFEYLEINTLISVTVQQIFQLGNIYGCPHVHVNIYLERIS